MKNLVENYKYNIKKIIRTITGSDNEDLEQEVYIKTWKNVTKYKEKGQFKSWISKITSNVCRDYLRSKEFRNSSICSTLDGKNDITDPSSASNIENTLIAKQRQNRILEAISNLKPKYKEAIILYEMQGLDYEQISKKLKCPIGTVKSRLYNARQELSIQLSDLL